MLIAPNRDDVARIPSVDALLACCVHTTPDRCQA